MSQPCALDKCTRISRGQCDCCQQQLCLQHLTEHNASLINQLNPLIDEINTLGDRLNVLSIDNIVGEGRRKLEQWRKNCHQQIDHLFEQKCQELDRIINDKLQKQHGEVNRLQSKIAEVIREQETTRQQIDTFTTTMHDLKQQMTEVEKTSLRVITRRLVLDNTLVSIDTNTEQELDLANLPSPCKTIDRPGGSNVVISANDEYLLMHRKPNLCLVDGEMNVVKEVAWDDKKIYDMCWCSTLDRFIVNEGNNLFLIDESTMTIEKVQTIEELRWMSCATSETYLFLSTDTWGSSIKKYSLSPSIKLVTEWTSPHTCANDEVIWNMKYNNGTLGLLIRNQSEKSLRMELRSTDTLSRIWSLRFDTAVEKNQMVYCCLIPCNEWLVADHETKRLLQITKDGKLKAVIPYERIPRHAAVFRDVVAISTDDPINIYKL